MHGMVLSRLHKGEGKALADMTGARTARGMPEGSTTSPRGGTSGDRSSERGTSAGDGLAAIDLVGVAKEFSARHGNVAAVREVDLEIRRGEFFSLLGPSGCGKTTTLRMIAGFEEPTRGRVLLYGQDVTGVPPYRRDVNMVFQSYALFPHMTVQDNVAFGLRRKGVGKAESAKRAAEMLELVELTGKGDSRPRELSGGQQQRVALARALVNHPRALLLDEPLGALDLKLRQAMQIELKRIQRDVGITFVYVTHDQNEALTMSDRLAVMNDGRIEQEGRPQEIYEQPATRFVAGFIGTSNLLSGRVGRVSDEQAVIEVSPDERIVLPLRRASGPQERAIGSGDEVELTVRPEKIAITGNPPGTDGSVLRGTVTEVVYLGTSTNFSVTTTTGADIVVFQQNSASGESQPARGETVWLSWDPQHSYPIG
jgi:spermidine/putrescine transport system ATP-binding protein